MRRPRGGRHKHKIRLRWVCLDQWCAFSSSLPSCDASSSRCWSSSSSYSFWFFLFFLFLFLISFMLFPPHLPDLPRYPCIYLHRVIPVPIPRLPTLHMIPLLPHCHRLSIIRIVPTAGVSVGFCVVWHMRKHRCGAASCAEEPCPTGHPDGCAPTTRASGARSPAAGDPSKAPGGHGPYAARKSFTASCAAARGCAAARRSTTPRWGAGWCVCVP